MHYELWDTSSGNFIAAPRTEDEAFALVRELIRSGADPNNLSLGMEPDDESEVHRLPPVLEGGILKTRAFDRSV